MPATAKLEALRAAIGPDKITERAGSPVISPTTTDEVAAVTRYAHANRLAIEIVGAGTKRTWGNPVSADLFLDTTRLTGVREHSWQDLTATVGAGTRWTDMQRALAQHNQFVALDPLWPGTATVGGIIATNDSGALRLRYGSLRDLIIGMTIVLADGTIARSGGKVVKNVAGYDLHKLMTGAFGTLGIITEVTFRLHPLPKHTQAFTVSAPQAAQLAPLMAAITDSHLLLEAMQLRGDSYGFHLDIQLNAHPDANQPAILQSMIGAQSSVVASKVSLGFSPGTSNSRESGFSPWGMPSTPTPQGTSNATIAPDRENGGSSGLQAAESVVIENSGFSPGPAANVWQAREILAAMSQSVILKIGVPAASVAKTASDIASNKGTTVAQSLGIVYAAFPFDAINNSACLRAIEDVALGFDLVGGSLLALTAPTNFTDEVRKWPMLEEAGQISGSQLPLMREIKHQFDPNRILNPGRFLGGI